MPEDTAEIEPEIQQEQTTLARVEEAENTAEIAIGIADETNAHIAQLEERITALLLRLDALESDLQNVRASDRTEPTGNPAETEGPPTEEPAIIQPRREHPYYRKLW